MIPLALCANDTFSIMCECSSRNSKYFKCFQDKIDTKPLVQPYSNFELKKKLKLLKSNYADNKFYIKGNIYSREDLAHMYYLDKINLSFILTEPNEIDTKFDSYFHTDFCGFGYVISSYGDPLPPDKLCCFACCQSPLCHRVSKSSKGEGIHKS